jgi:arylsulfatase A-like enzyme
MPEHWKRLIGQFLSNTDAFQHEDDWFAAQVVDKSVAWLKANRSHPKTLLWIDSFDPHEPWDPPRRFDTYTDPDYQGPRLIMPLGGKAADWATPDQVRYIRGLYAGECAYVDDRLGRLFHPLADHGKFLKGADRLYSELLKVPFMIRLPKGEHGGTRSHALVQYHDVLPTLLDLLGYGNNADAMHGRSFRALLSGDADQHRDAIITGYYEGADRAVRDQAWSFISRPADEPDELYNLRDDPGEQRNLIDQYPDEARRLAARFGAVFYRQRPPHLKGVQGRYELQASGLETGH